ncbi:IS3 family transposase, partial [Fictibacillus fluitans]
MSKIIFTDFQQKQLEKNPNVKHVSERSIAYLSEFKLKAVKENIAGKGPKDIFIEHGFDLQMIGPDKPNQCLKRWRKTFEKHGETGLETDLRGKGSTGRPSSKEQTVEDQLKKAEARIAFLEMENGVLKKARGTRKAGEEKIARSDKFGLIEAALRNHQMKGMVSYLCCLAGVKRKSYYAWLKAENKRIEKEYQDEQDVQLIRQIHQKSKGKAGGQFIKMALDQEYGVNMNLKKIYRLMNKYNIHSNKRRANPYRKMAKATQEHRTCAHVLDRKFVQDEPERVLLTDITYLYLKNGTPAYLSCVKDGATRKILAYYLSSSLKMEIVYKTLNRLQEALDGNIHPEAILHSDQGMHYTHPEFRNRVKKLGFIQSMSRKGNCWDNAPMESFFGHMKDEIDASTCTSLEELRRMIEDYIEYYNTLRYQWTLKRMTPEQYRDHL